MNDVDNIGSACMESGTGNGYNEVQKTKGHNSCHTNFQQLALISVRGK